MIDEDDYRPGDAKVVRDLPDYPRAWTPELRLTAYWERLRTGAAIQTNAGWEAVLKQAEQRASRRRPQRGHDAGDDIEPF